MMFELEDDLLEDFISECIDLLDEVEPELVSSSELNKELADKLFRPVHSIKGSAASMGFNALAKCVHHGETLLTYFRDKNAESSEDAFIRYFLDVFDFIRKVLGQLLDTKSDEDFVANCDELVAEASKLEAILNGEEPAPQVAVEKSAEPLAQSSSEEEKIIEPASTSEAIDDEMIDDIELGEDMIQAFTAESEEALGAVESALLDLSRSPENKEPLREAFRNIHSFKGNCGIFSLKDFETLSHRLETLFQRILDGKLKGDKGIYGSVLPIVDVLKDCVRSLSPDATSIDGLNLYLELISNLDPESESEEAQEGSNEIKPLVEQKSEEPKAPSAGPTEQEKKEARKEAMKKKAKEVKRNDIRVDVAKLDSLNNLVGELVTAKTMILELRAGYQGEQELFEKAFRFLDRVTNDLHDSAMNIRMVPIAGLFKRMIRIVHDISTKSGKKVDFDFFGEETEIDKTLVERISDPLVHMIRNAVDHGVESEADRLAAGKPSRGRVTVGAKNESGEVWIVITDDGKGLDKEKILNKAIEKGVVSPDDQLSDKQIYSLIFAPGFSTAEQVTDISGRGVGMDVVNQNIKSLKGKVEIESVLGKGTTFYIKIPLTLAIVSGMVVRVGESFYSLPIESIRESVKVTPDQVSRPFESKELVKIREHMVPVIRLRDLYQIPDSVEKIEDGVLVIVEAKGEQVAIMVDQLVGQKETVVKPLPKYLKSIKGIAGCSITGSGEASLILDTVTLVDLVKEKENGESQHRSL